MYQHYMKGLMRNSFKLRMFLVVGLLGMGCTSLLQGQSMIYSNSFNDLGTRFDPGIYEVGDQIIFAGTDRNLTFFDFEYWGINTSSPYFFAGNVQARVRFYLNDGAPFNGYPTPGTMFFDSGWFGGFAPSPRSTIQFTTLDFGTSGLHLPDDEITWSVQFQGMGGTDTVGLDLYSPPTVGQNYDDYWEFDGSSWSLLVNTNGLPMDFGARFYAIPEPSSLVLSLAGGMGILMLVRRLRRAE